MRCPRDGSEHGCGIWLDAGELADLEVFYEKAQGEVQIPITWRLWAAVRSHLPKKRAR